MTGAYVPITQVDVAEGVVIEAEIEAAALEPPGNEIVVDDLERPKLSVASVPIDFKTARDGYYLKSSLVDTWTYGFDANVTLKKHWLKPVIVQVDFDLDSSLPLVQKFENGDAWYFTVDVSQLVSQAVVVYSSIRDSPSIYTKKALLVIAGILQSIPTYQIGVHWSTELKQYPDSPDDSLAFGISIMVTGGFGHVKAIPYEPPASALISSPPSPTGEEFVVVPSPNMGKGAGI